MSSDPPCPALIRHLIYITCIIFYVISTIFLYNIILYYTFILILIDFSRLWGGPVSDGPVAGRGGWDGSMGRACGEGPGLQIAVRPRPIAIPVT